MIANPLSIRGSARINTMLHNQPDVGTRGQENAPGFYNVERMAYKSLDHTLATMKNMVLDSRSDLTIRHKAVEITQNVPVLPQTGLPNRRNFDALANSIYNWMKHNIHYVRDPHNTELLQSPARTLEFAHGDCDDQAMLAAAFLSSLGVPTAFKVVATNKKAPKSYNHVYTIYAYNGQWKAFDPTLHTHAGDELTAPIFNEKIIGLDDSHPVQPQPLNDMSNFFNDSIEIYDIAKDECGCGSSAMVLADNGLADPLTATIAVATAVDKLSSIFRKNKKALTDCGEAQREMERIFNQYLTTQDLQTIAAWHTHGPLSGTSASALAFHYLGGDDCRVTSSGGKAWTQRVTDLVNQRITEAEAAAARAAATSNVPAVAGFALGNMSPTVKVLGGLLLAAGIGYGVYKFAN